jgi:hypothetical protein
LKFKPKWNRREVKLITKENRKMSVKQTSAGEIIDSGYLLGWPPSASCSSIPAVSLLASCPFCSRLLDCSCSWLPLQPHWSFIVHSLTPRLQLLLASSSASLVIHWQWLNSSTCFCNLAWGVGLASQSASPGLGSSALLTQTCQGGHTELKPAMPFWPGCC